MVMLNNTIVDNIPKCRRTKWQVICDDNALLSVGYLYVEVVGSQDQLKEGSLVHLSEK